MYQIILNKGATYW